jgi:hypothetical protein
LAQADPRGWLVVDGRLPRKAIESAIWERVSVLLQRESNG